MTFLNMEVGLFKGKGSLPYELNYSLKVVCVTLTTFIRRGNKVAIELKFSDYYAYSV